MDCRPPGSSVHGISQARILAWVAISFPGDLLNLGIKRVSPALAFFTTEPPGKPINNIIYKLYCMLYCSISAIIRFGLNIPITKSHYNQIVYSKKKIFFFVGVTFGTFF